MKLFLTSSGLTNQTLVQALHKLIGDTENHRLAFIPTAANIEEGDKDWLITDLDNARGAGFEVDIVDISALPKEVWQPRLEAAQVLLFSGGNTFYLMHWLQKSGLAELLPELLQTRVYAGISAGSCVAGPSIYNSVQNLAGDEEVLKIKEGLHLVDFQVVPHLNSSYFTNVTEKNVREAAKEVAEPVYALDNQSAVMVDGDAVEVVSEGEWCLVD